MKLNITQGYCARLRQYRVLIGSLAIGFAMLASPASGWAASCNGKGYIRVLANIPSTINISPTLTVGSVIGTTTTSFPSGSVPGCVIPGTPGQVRVYGPGIPNGTYYPTTIPGISYQLRFTAGWTISGIFNTPWPANGTYSNPAGFMDQSYGGGTITIDLIKTGPISGSGGTWTPDVLGNMDTITQGVTWTFMQIYNTQTVIVQPTTPACTITQSAITVNLDDTTTSQLATTGNTSKDKGFNIPLNCTSDSNISLAFSGSIADNTNAVFSNLSGGANAGTVGVQILNGGTPVPTTAGSYLNLGTVNGNYSVPLTARYYALANNPDAGDVHAIAYATIQYN
ncbi:fimbrial protein [Serratia fonticola]